MVGPPAFDGLRLEDSRGEHVSVLATHACRLYEAVMTLSSRVARSGTWECRLVTIANAAASSARLDAERVRADLECCQRAGWISFPFLGLALRRLLL
jgi:hypothetical protein